MFFLNYNNFVSLCERYVVFLFFLNNLYVIMAEVDKLISDVATRLFVEKGYDSTSMRDIAAAANVNLSAINYYYSSKEMLFDSIFNNAVDTIVADIMTTIEGEMPVRARIKLFVDALFVAMEVNPVLPGFIFQEVYNRPERFIARYKINTNVSERWESFLSDIEREGKEGIIKPINNPTGVLIAIVSSICFPYIANRIIMPILKSNQKKYSKFLLNRKEDGYKLVDYMLNVE